MVTLGSNAINILIKATDQASATLDAVKGKVGGLGSAVTALRGPLMAVGAASVGMAALSTKSFADFESGLAEVETLMNDGESAMETYGDEVRRISKELGVAGGTAEVTAGLYQTLSSGITDTTEATLFLETATKAAIGGNAELDSVINAGTKTLAAYGLEVSETERVFDVFAATVKAGQTTMPELANAFPKVSGMAGEMGVSLEETAGVLAGLTKIMPDTDQAATSLQAVMTGLLKPSDAMKETLNKLGYESAQAAIEENGLMGTLQLLKAEVGDDAEAMGELFGNVRALRAVFPALGEASDDIAESMNIVNESTGLMQSQFETMEDTTSHRMQKLKNTFMDMALNLGEKLVPILEKLMPVFESLIDLFGSLDPVIQIVVLGVGALAGALATFMPVLSPIIGAIGGSGGLTAVLGALTGPIGIVIAAVALLAAAWATDFGGIRTKVMEVVEKLKPIFEKLMKLVERVANILGEVLWPVAEFVFNSIAQLVGLWWDFYLKPLLDIFIWHLELVIDAFDALLSAIQGDMEPLKNLMKRMQEDIRNIFTSILNSAWEFGTNLINNIINAIKDIGWKIADTIWSFIPTADDIAQGVSSSISNAGSFIGNTGSYLNPFNDFIMRPGQGAVAFSPDDTIIGVKNPGALTGNKTTNVYIGTVNLSPDYTYKDMMRHIAEHDEEELSRVTNQ